MSFFLSVYLSNASVLFIYFVFLEFHCGFCSFCLLACSCGLNVLFRIVSYLKIVLKDNDFWHTFLFLLSFYTADNLWSLLNIRCIYNQLEGFLHNFLSHKKRRKKRCIYNQQRIQGVRQNVFLVAFFHLSCSPHLLVYLSHLLLYYFSTRGVNKRLEESWEWVQGTSFFADAYQAIALHNAQTRRDG